MSLWKLADCLEPPDEDADNPSILIHSEAQLRQELERLRHRVQGLVILSSPDEDALSISIGGPFASFGWVPSPNEHRSKGQKEALAGRLYSSQPIESWAEGIPTKINPESIFPVEQAIQAIVYFYKTHELPRWISWREWFPATMQWKVTPAQGVAQGVPA